MEFRGRIGQPRRWHWEFIVESSWPVHGLPMEVPWTFWEVCSDPSQALCVGGTETPLYHSLQQCVSSLCAKRSQWGSSLLGGQKMLCYVRRKCQWVVIPVLALTVRTGTAKVCFWFFSIEPKWKWLDTRPLLVMLLPLKDSRGNFSKRCSPKGHVSMRKSLKQWSKREESGEEKNLTCAQL